MREYKCFQVLHAGEGPLSEEFLDIMGACSASDAAEQAAHFFSDGFGSEDDQNICVEDESGARQYFRVSAEVKVVYTASAGLSPEQVVAKLDALRAEWIAKGIIRKVS